MMYDMTIYLEPGKKINFFYNGFPTSTIFNSSDEMVFINCNVYSSFRSTMISAGGIDHWIAFDNYEIRNVD